jgi:putative tricarboxylic transport membrane protein
VALIFGVLGYFMRKLGFPMAPMVLATVLAQMLEASFQQSLLISQGSFLVFFTRPIAAAFMVLGFLSVVRGVWAELREQRLERAEEDKD